MRITHSFFIFGGLGEYVMIRIQARTLLDYDPIDLRDNYLTGKFIIIFDNKEELEVTAEETIYTCFIWEIFKGYEEVLLTKKLFLRDSLEDGYVNSETHRVILSECIRTIVDVYKLYDVRDQVTLWHRIPVIINNLFNEIALEYPEFYDGFSIFDFYGIIDTEEYEELYKTLEPTPSSIRNFNKSFFEYLKHSPLLDDNNLAIAMRRGVVSLSQGSKCTGAPPGFIVAPTGHIMREPLLNSFLMGIGGISELTRESSQASLAYIASKAPLETSEAANRRVGYVTSVLTHVSYTDCGSTDYVEHRILGSEIDQNGKQLYKGDFDGLLGKYFYDEDVKAIRPITKRDKHLIGTTVKLRHSFTCKHENPHAVCVVCLGKQAYNTGINAHLGFTANTTLYQKLSNSMLKRKHDQTSAEGNGIHLSTEMIDFFTLGDKNLSLLLKPTLQKKIRIHIPNRNANGITDIFTKRLEDVDPLRVSNINEILIEETKNGVVREHSLQIGQYKRKLYITRQLMEYMKTSDLQYDKTGNFIIDLEDFNRKEPLFFITDQQSDLLSLTLQVTKLIESKIASLPERLQSHSPYVVLTQLFTITQDLGINMTTLEAILYPFLVRGKDDYRLARGSESPLLGVALDLTRNRSLGVMLAYRDHLQTLTDPRSFSGKNRVDSCYDVIFAPNKYIERYYK